MNGERIRVGTDFDDTFKRFKIPFLNWNNEFHGTNLRIEDAPGYDMSKFMGFADWASYMERVCLYHEYEMTQSELAVIEEAVEVMRRLEDRIDFFILSARPARFKDYSLAQLRLALPNKPAEAYHNEDYVELGMTKGQLAKALGAVALLDDHPEHVDSAIEAGIKGYLVSDDFNAGYEGKATRVNDWYEIEAELVSLHETLSSAA